MPALPSPGNIIRLVIPWTIGEDAYALTRLFFRWSGTTPTPAVLASLADDASTPFFSDLQPLFGSTVYATGIELQDLSSAEGAEAVNTFDVPGTRAGGQLPAEVCVITNYTIGRRYRGGHPRSYWPFGVESDLQDRQTWTTAFLDAVQLGVEDFTASVSELADSGTSLGDQVNVSFYEGFTVVTSPTTGRARNLPKVRTSPLVNDIMAITANPKIGSQRRRSMHSR